MTLEVEQVVAEVNSLGANPSDITPEQIGFGMHFLGHDLEIEQKMFGDGNVWACQRCSARGDDLGCLPVVCDE